MSVCPVTCRVVIALQEYPKYLTFFTVNIQSALVYMSNRMAEGGNVNTGVLSIKI